MSDPGLIPLDSDLNVGPDTGMRALAHSRKSSRNPALRWLGKHAPALVRAAPRAAAQAFPPAPPGVTPDAVTGAEPPAETDAWWLSRSQTATFTRRRIALTGACGRALEAAPGRLVVEFNGARFGGATLAASDGRYELELGDALAEEMAEVLDEDDGLAVEVLAGRGQPTLAIHPYVGEAD
jgi:hypothetical protein